MTRDDPIGCAGQTRSYTPATALSSAITTLPGVEPILHLVVGEAQGVGTAAPALLISPDGQVAGHPLPRDKPLNPTVCEAAGV